VMAPDIYGDQPMERFVLWAGTWTQAMDWCELHQINWKDQRLVIVITKRPESGERLRGLSRGVQYVTHGTWNVNPDPFFYHCLRMIDAVHVEDEHGINRILNGSPA
jgi:hypothetical protein